MITLKMSSLISRSSKLNTIDVIYRLKNITISYGICNPSSHLSTSSFLNQTNIFDSNEVDNKSVSTKKYGIRDEKSSKAMRAYLERAQAYNEFMQKERDEFIVGRRHLANIMGRDVENFTQKDINDSIAYLLPSALYDIRARPFLKPPEEVFPPKKDAEFDETGRPYHFLFYTGKPNFYNVLHTLVAHLRELNAFEDTMIRKQIEPDPKLKLTVEGSKFMSKEELDKKLVEELFEQEYNQLVNLLERLIAHPYSYRIKDVIMEYRQPLILQSTTFNAIEPQIHTDGRKFVVFKESRRKTAIADVTLWSPGTGNITINGSDLTYFEDVQCREQLLFPLLFTGKLKSIDVEATVTGGGPSGQAGAIRWAISWALRSFVDQDMMEKMRIAGLLTRDIRRRERKKPGQMKARRKYTWKKR